MECLLPPGIECVDALRSNEWAWGCLQLFVGFFYGKGLCVQVISECILFYLGQCYFNIL